MKYKHLTDMKESVQLIEMLKHDVQVSITEEHMIKYSITLFMYTKTRKKHTSKSLLNKKKTQIMYNYSLSISSPILT